MSPEGGFGLGFMAGFLAAVVLGVIVSLVATRRNGQYGLGHWKLNVQTPLRSMWMNVGYWQVCTIHPLSTHSDRVHHHRRDVNGQQIADFPEASAALLHQVLAAAGLTATADALSTNPVAILDLGFGCGDQTWDVTKLLHATRPSFRYVGLSLNADQVHSAQRRIYREVAAHDTMDTADTLRAVSIFCANAAKPETWTPRIAKAVGELADEAFAGERWLLALDCLYHFRPSRRPVFEYAARSLRANLMVFDLVLGEKPSARNLFLLRLVSVVMDCPAGTFVTEAAYRRQLVDCGFDADSVVVRDVTEHVFSHLAAFLGRHDAALAEYSISLGGFKLAQRLFDWFAASGVVRAVVVVARVGA